MAESVDKFILKHVLSESQKVNLIICLIINMVSPLLTFVQTLICDESYAVSAVYVVVPNLTSVVRLEISVHSTPISPWERGSDLTGNDQITSVLTGMNPLGIITSETDHIKWVRDCVVSEWDWSLFSLPVWVTR